MTPWTFSTAESSVHGISQARMMEWIAISFFRGSSWPRDQTGISCIDRWILYHWVTGETHDSPIRTCRKLQTASLSANTSRTTASAGSHGPSDKAACTAAWTCGTVSSHSGPTGSMQDTGWWGWCTGMTQRDGTGRKVGGGSGLGTCVHPWQIHVDVWQNQYNIVKLKKKKTSSFLGHSVNGPQ